MIENQEWKIYAFQFLSLLIFQFNEEYTLKEDCKVQLKSSNE